MVIEKSFWALIVLANIDLIGELHIRFIIFVNWMGP
jgi:hypothetical protein